MTPIAKVNELASRVFVDDLEAFSCFLTDPFPLSEQAPTEVGAYFIAAFLPMMGVHYGFSYWNGHCFSSMVAKPWGIQENASFTHPITNDSRMSVIWVGLSVPTDQF